MPGGEWKMTEQDDDTIAVMNLRWCPPPNDMFMAATATGGILAIWQISKRVQELCACMRAEDDEFYGLDWTMDGAKICVGGAAKTVKVYDPHCDMACVISEFETAALNGGVSGHINRITAVNRAVRMTPSGMVCRYRSKTLIF